MLWRYFEKINHLHDFWLVLGNNGLKARFSCLYTAILYYFFYAYRAIMDSIFLS